MAETTTDCVTVFYNGAFLPIANGGNARLVDLLDRLHREFERLIVYSYADHADFPWSPAAERASRQRWPRVELVLERQGRKLRFATRVKNLLLCLAPPRLATWLMGASVPGATPRFTDVKRRTGVLLISYTEGLTQLNGVDPRRCIVETHDVNFVKWAKMHERRPVSVTALRKLRTEMTLLEPCLAMVAIAPGEAAFFRMMIEGATVALVPSWGTAPAACAAPTREAPLYDLVFAGSSYIMNVRGFCALLEQHGAWLGRYRFAVCGGVCDDPAVRALAQRYPGVTLLGYVPDLASIYARSRAAVSPVDGTGVKMKVLGALEAGLPVFASAQSRAGLPPGYEGAVFPIDGAGVAKLLECEATHQTASEAARRYSAALRSTSDATGLIDMIRAHVPTNRKPGPEIPAT